MKSLYIDFFEECMTTKKDPIAPPERYLEIECGDSDIFIERYSCGDFTYTLEERNKVLESEKLGISCNDINIKRANFLVDKDSKVKIKLIVPPSIFKEYKKFYYRG